MIFNIKGQYNQYHEIQSYGSVEAQIEAETEAEALEKFNTVCGNNGFIDDEETPGILKFELTEDLMDTTESGEIEVKELEVSHEV
jgi:hypothetical protein